MINEFNGVGNLGADPVLEPVVVSGENRKVTNMRVFFDRPIRSEKDGKYKDKGGFWLTVDIWGYRAEEAMRLLKKGTRIFVKGSLREEVWNDENGEEKSNKRLSADYFFIDTVCVESIAYKENSENKMHHETVRATG